VAGPNITLRWMAKEFDFVIVGGGSSGAVVAARLSEDPSCEVALIEAGGHPPPEELMPAACSMLELNPETDWMFTADAGGAGLGLREGRMMVPRGKMLGGSSGINYSAYVRGHPGDFDAWAANGAVGWSYDEVLPYFKKSEGLVPTVDIIVDVDVHNMQGPLGVSVPAPINPGSREFVDAAVAAGIPAGDYNGDARRGSDGVSSLFQTTIREGKRSSTYHAFLEGAVEQRPNLTVITNAQVTRIVLAGSPGELTARGVEYSTAEGESITVLARMEVVLCAGAVGTPQILLLSGIGPQSALETVGIPCRHDSPGVGKHLKDHLEVILFFPAPGVGVSMAEISTSLGPDALRAPYGPLPADPADDAALSGDLKALKEEAERRLTVWQESGFGMASSSLYEAAAWFSTGLGDLGTHDAQIAFLPCGGDPDGWRESSRINPDEFFDDPGTRLHRDAESMLVLANPVQPHSEGEIVLTGASPDAPLDIRMNYFDDPHDMKVMIAVIRRSLDVVAHWPTHHQIGPLQIPPHLASKHGHNEGDAPSDALLEDFARHYACTVYHLTSTCRIGTVVDPRLCVIGMQGLRVADASVMPNVVSGNTNAAAIMIGEKAAEIIAADHGMQLHEFVGSR
jgi:choline dehydrogenase